MYISDYFGNGQKGHSLYNFVDVNIDKDNRLFIDPVLISLGLDEWSIQARKCIDSFFDTLFMALKANDVLELFAHAHEQNATKLGYGNGNNGKGKTSEGLDQSLRGLKQLVQDITTISKCEDLPILVEGFAEDCMSDLLTNILHKQLAEFTAEQMYMMNVPPTDILSFWYWNTEQEKWEKSTMPSWTYKGRELLLVPKQIVRKNYLFKAHQYLMVVIIERLQAEHGLVEIPKKDVYKTMTRKTEHWEYEYVKSYTYDHPDALEEYHRRVPYYYGRKHGKMSDEDLDKCIYENIILKSE